jgi:gamma-glutamylcyclotransferase (GGCT)/AIG2-like uncharacterized protein YtfP
MSEHLVFVYGTLREGGVRAMSLVAPNCTDLGRADLHGRLFDLGAFPGLQLDSSAGLVHGELYQVDDATLSVLDDIEQYFPDREAESYYVRISVTVSHNGAITPCWTYEVNPRYFDLNTEVESGDWISYFAAKVDVPEERWPDGAPIAK